MGVYRPAGAGMSRRRTRWVVPHRTRGMTTRRLANQAQAGIIVWATASLMP